MTLDIPSYFPPQLLISMGQIHIYGTVLVTTTPYIKRFGAPGEIRTPDPQVRSLVLYPTELRAHKKIVTSKK